MAFYDEDDLDVFFDTDDFGITALIGTAPNQVEIAVIFNEGTEKYNPSAGGVISTAPEIMCKTSDALSMKKNDVITIGSKNWKIVTPPKPDGTGVATFGLQEA